MTHILDKLFGSTFVLCSGYKPTTPKDKTTQTLRQWFTSKGYKPELIKGFYYNEQEDSLLVPDISKDVATKAMELWNQESMVYHCKYGTFLIFTASNVAYQATDFQISNIEPTFAENKTFIPSLRVWLTLRFDMSNPFNLVL